MDLLVSNLEGIVTPTMLSGPSSTPEYWLRKQQLRICATPRTYGLELPSLCSGSFGSLRCDARRFVGAVLAKRSTRFALFAPHEDAHAVWSALVSAVILRAGHQLSRHAAIDRPHGFPLSALGNEAAPLPTASRVSRSDDPTQFFVKLIDGKTLTLRSRALAGLQGTCVFDLRAAKTGGLWAPEQQVISPSGYREVVVVVRNL